MCVKRCLFKGVHGSIVCNSNKEQSEVCQRLNKLQYAHTVEHYAAIIEDADDKGLRGKISRYG